MRIWWTALTWAAGATLLSCGDSGEGESELLIALSAEQSISRGLDPGADVDNTVDQCQVRYDKYLVALGNVKVSRTSDGASATLPQVYIADMLQVGEHFPLGSLGKVASGQWDQFSFETPVASATSSALTGVLPEDAARIRERGLTYVIEGRVSCPEKSVTFSLELAAPTAYERCSIDGEPGIAVREGGTTPAKITLHGDHLWFNTLSAGEEMTVQRRAAWLLRADKNGDGAVDNGELSALPAEQAFPRSEYEISGATITNALEFARAQLSTQGHLNGEGDCVPRPL